jgi:uncharacterized LabA/DUF88 family protein
MKTIVYVDAFNLYYGALKGTPYKWLDLSKLCQLLLPQHQLEHIHYFTALILPRPHDPQQPQRQQLYLRALQTIPNLSITYGHFLSQEVMMKVVNPLPGQAPYVNVIKTEEKGSDVNIAAQLLKDAFTNQFDTAVLISNDSDLVLPLKIARQDLAKKVGILNPYNRPSRTLLAQADFIRQIRSGVLNLSQFPATLTDGRGRFGKPSGW